MEDLDPVLLHATSWCRKTLHTWGFGGHIWPNTFFT